MNDGPVIAKVAALLGDPARANMLTALLDGRALTVSELTLAAGVALPTASGHLAKLQTAGLVTQTKQGRHRYFRLSGADVAEVLEGLMGLAQRTGAVPARTGPREGALRAARVCYDHLAGERAVALARALEGRGFITLAPEALLTEPGREFFEDLGINIAALARARRPLCRACLDWSERRAHIAGGLGAAILQRVLGEGWARRGEGRIIAFSATGRADFERAFGLA